MARGGYRPGAGRKKKSAPEQKSKKSNARPEPIPADIKADAKAARKKPLDYMLDVLNDPKVDDERKDRIAIAAAPYVHPRKQPVGAGKKEQQDEAAKKAGGGKFATPHLPRLAVDNTA